MNGDYSNMQEEEKEIIARFDLSMRMSVGPSEEDSIQIFSDQVIYSWIEQENAALREVKLDIAPYHGITTEKATKHASTVIDLTTDDSDDPPLHIAVCSWFPMIVRTRSAVAIQEAAEVYKELLLSNVVKRFGIVTNASVSTRARMRRKSCPTQLLIAKFELLMRMCIGTTHSDVIQIFPERVVCTYIEENHTSLSEVALTISPRKKRPFQKNESNNRVPPSQSATFGVPPAQESSFCFTCTEIKQGIDKHRTALFQQLMARFGDKKCGKSVKLSNFAVQKSPALLQPSRQLRKPFSDLSKEMESKHASDCMDSDLDTKPKAKLLPTKYDVNEVVAPIDLTTTRTNYKDSHCIGKGACQADGHAVTIDSSKLSKDKENMFIHLLRIGINKATKNGSIVSSNALDLLIAEAREKAEDAFGCSMNEVKATNEVQSSSTRSLDMKRGELFKGEQMIQKLHGPPPIGDGVKSDETQTLDDLLEYLSDSDTWS